MKSPITLEIFGLAVAVLLLTPSNAWAYIDPGTGSYLFQLTAAAFFAGAYTVRRYWQTLKEIIKGLRHRQPDGGKRDDGR